MKKLISLFVVSFSAFTSAYAAQETISPVGYWKTVDDVSGEPKSIVAVYEGPNHVLVGKVLKLFNDPERICTACEGDLRNQPIVGMVVMTNLKQSLNRHDEWSGGKILDPKNGKSYQCNVKLSDSGQKMSVRGFIGLPLFGRSQTWERMPESY